MFDPRETDQWHTRLALLRKAKGLSVRALALEAGVSPATLSAVERGQSSPTLATLQRILRALESDFASFFAAPEGEEDPSPVFRADRMKRITDPNRTYTLAFPKRDDIRIELVREQILPEKGEGEWESHPCDMAGIVVEGGRLTVEIEGARVWDLESGDAFYIKAGQRHRGRNNSDAPVRLVTVYTPPRY